MLRLLLKDMLHYRGQAIFNILGLAVIVLSYFLLAGLAETCEKMVRQDNASRNMFVLQNQSIDISESNIEDGMIQAAHTLIPSLVEDIEPMIVRTIRIEDNLVQLRAAPLASWEKIFRLKLLEGHWPVDQNEIAVGQGAQLAYHWNIGSVINVYGREFMVAGVLQAPGDVFASVWIPFETAQNLFAPRRNAQILVIQASPGIDPNLIKATLLDNTKLNNSYTILYEDDITRDNIKSLLDISRVLHIIATIGLGSIIFGAYIFTGLTIEEHSRETGILRTLGFSTPTIRAYLVVRAILLGFMAFLPGLGAALTYAAYESHLATLQVLGVPFIFQISLSSAFSTLGWMLALPALGAWLAARRSLKESVMQNLREYA